MRAAVIVEPGRIAIEERPIPQPGPGEVLVRSAAVGICGTDVELFEGRHPPEYCRYPLVPGHEWAGTVVALGPGVQHVAVGDHVAVEGFVACGTCRNCRRGLTDLCERGYDELGFTRPGGAAEYVVVPARQLHRLPPEAALDEAPLLEPSAVVVHSFLRAHPEPGDLVVVIGDGTIGLLAVQVARLYSPRAIVLVGRHPERLAAGRELGATETINARDGDPVMAFQQRTGERGADFVFEGAGRADAVEQAFAFARRGGTVALTGAAGAGAQLTIPSDLFVFKHLTVVGTFGASTVAWEQAVALFSAGLLRLRPLISHRFPLADYATALDTLRTRQPGVIKVLVEHDGVRA
ncbi:MAG: alcohol dehydrogenase catalytic domain-containing protein [Thermorudis peleae]|nr:alcohol dehydrogenase catalytic domain-containing protein [Thermorudis peleae]